MTMHEGIVQRSPEWFALRAAKITASNFDKLFMGKSTKGYQDLINTVAYEKITGDVPESYENDWMRRGNDLEPEARSRYLLASIR